MRKLQLHILALLLMAVPALAQDNGVQLPYQLVQTRICELWNKPLLSDKRPIIAIIDTGVETDHPDLLGNIWTNYAELNGTPGVDDDNNGYIDDYNGWNFSSDTNDITDTNGHGTICSAIAAGSGKINPQALGANPNALIMPLKVNGGYKNFSNDDIPGGAQYLDAIGKALTENLRLHIEHRKFVDDKSRHLTIEPYCIKSKERRWYLLARNVETGEMRTYALDRMLSLELTEEHFTPDSSIDLNKYYSNCIGVYTNNTSFTEVVIRVTEFQAKYLHTLPLHSSQREISPCVFKYQVDVTPDLINEILKMGANAEVLEPLSLRETVMGVIEKMNGNYCKEMIYL